MNDFTRNLEFTRYFRKNTNITTRSQTARPRSNPMLKYRLHTLTTRISRLIADCTP